MSDLLPRANVKICTKCGTTSDVAEFRQWKRWCRECERAYFRSHPTHPLHPKEHNSWRWMVRRCTNQNSADYPNYGGRGIKVCERWRSFENFYADMGNRPGPEYSIDRIDNDGNYEPGNCKWSTKAEQNRNQRRVKLSPMAVRVIRRLIANKMAQCQIASVFSVSPNSIGSVARGKNWTHAETDNV